MGIERPAITHRTARSPLLLQSSSPHDLQFMFRSSVQEETEKSAEGKSVQTKNYPSHKLGLIDAVIDKMAKSNTRMLRYREQIKQMLLDNLSLTPDHPAYAAMIHRAISESKGKRAPSEEEISDFIRQEYRDTNLAAAHSSMLKIHLIKLCKKGEIVCTIENRYIFPANDSDSVAKLKQWKRQKRSHRNIRKHKAEKDDEFREGMTPVHRLHKKTGHDHQIKELEDQNRTEEGMIAICQGQNRGVNDGDRHAGQPWMDKPMEREQACEQNVNGFGDHILTEVSRANQHETEVTEERPGVIAQGENQATEGKNERRGLYEKGEGQITEENHLMEAPMSEEIKENDKPEIGGTEEEIDASVLETRVLEEHAEVTVKQKNQAKGQTNEPTSELCERLMDQRMEEQHYLEEPLGGAIEEKDKCQTIGGKDIGDEVPIQEIDVLEGQMGLSRLERNPGQDNTPKCAKKHVESAATTSSLPNSFFACENFRDSIPNITLMKCVFMGMLKRTKEIQQDFQNVVDFLSLLDGPNTNYPRPVMEVAETGHLLKTLSASVDVLNAKMQLMQGKQCKPVNIERALEFTGECEKFSQKLKMHKQFCDQQMALHLNQNSIPTTAEPDYISSDVMLDQEQDNQPDFRSERDNQPDGTLTEISVNPDVQHLKSPSVLKLASMEKFSPRDKKASSCDKGKETECKEQQEESLTDNRRELESAEPQIQQLQQTVELQQREPSPMVPRPSVSEPFTAVVDDPSVPLSLLESERKQKLRPSSINQDESEAQAHHGSHELGKDREEQSQPMERLVELKFARKRHLRPLVQGPVPGKEDLEQCIVERPLSLFPQQDQQQQTEGPDHVQSNQPEQEQPQHPRLGRPPKRKVNDIEEALPLNDDSFIHVQSNHSGQQHTRGGRPPKRKVTDLGESSPSNDQNQTEELRLHRRIQGRPNKYQKTENAKCPLAESSSLHVKDNKQPQKRRGRPPKSRPEAGTTVHA